MEQEGPDQTRVVLVITTVATRADAESLGHRLVEERLAACAQVTPIDSIYRWEGVVRREIEWRLLLKTSVCVQAALMSALRDQHPYALPAIVVLPCTAVLPEFADWVGAETRPIP